MHIKHYETSQVFPPHRRSTMKRCTDMIALHIVYGLIRFFSALTAFYETTVKYAFLSIRVLIASVCKKVFSVMGRLHGVKR